MNQIDTWSDSMITRELRHLHQDTSGSRNEILDRLKSALLEESTADGSAYDGAHGSVVDDQEEELRQLRLQLEILETKEKIKNSQFRLSQPPGTAVSTAAKSQPVTELTQVLNEVRRTNNIHEAYITDPGTFSGDPKLYRDWKASFLMFIDARELRDYQKILLLKRHLSGDALSCVNGFLELGTDESFDEALETLDYRYGSDLALADSFRDSLENWPKINSVGNGRPLRQYADFLKHCMAAKRTLRHLSILDDPRTLQKLARTLPTEVIKSWSDAAGRHRIKYNDYPLFDDYVTFVAKRADIASDHLMSVDAILGRDKEIKQRSDRSANQRQATPKLTPKKLSFATESGDDHTIDSLCLYCKASEHSLAECPKFSKLSNQQKKSLVYKEKLCFGCLRPNHTKQTCSTPLTCKTCGSNHPTALHFKRQGTKPLQGEENPESTVCLATSNSVRGETFAPIHLVYVSVLEHPETEIPVYLLDDSASDGTIITDFVCDALETSPKVERTISMTTMTSCNQIIKTSVYDNICVRGFKSDNRVLLNEVYTRKHIAVNRDHIPTGARASKYSHLQHVAHAIPNLMDLKVGILLGYNNVHALAWQESIRGKKDEPIGVRTAFGWTMVGGVKNDDLAFTHRLLTHNLTDKMILDSLQENLTVDHSEKKVSQNDLLFMKIMQENISKENDHYSLPLPFRERPRLPDNSSYVMGRFSQLKNRLNRNAEFKHKYFEFMDNMVSNGEAELALGDTAEGECWYIPHHGVYHPHKPGKLRVVFDCSAKYRGQSLNGHLLQGPDLTNNLVGILLRFRKDKVAVSCDIKSMFHQFRVHRGDRDYLRFFWYGDGGKIVPYRMNVHLFGAASSPSCSNFGLKALASDHESSHPSAAKFVKENFYVDDGLISVPSSQAAIDLIDQTRDLCSKGGLILHKFVTNNDNVSQHLNISDSPEVKLPDSACTIQHALGVIWDVASDSFKFEFKPKQAREMTKRGLLSTVASIYDPTGFISPVVLHGRLLLQEVCKTVSEWDHPLNDPFISSWMEWIANLDRLSEISIPRCFLSSSSPAKVVELHTFSDASFKAYGCCSILRIVHLDNQVSTALLMSKAKVAPCKQTVTIPRLELQAAVLSVKVADFVVAELKYDHLQKFFHSDSTTVLGYIQNDSKRFHTFVANRVQRIRDTSQVDHWSYISSESNPADIVSRGDSPDGLLAKTWFNGPAFLQSPEYTFRSVIDDVNHGCDLKLQDGDREVRWNVVHATVSDPCVDVSLFDRFGKWSKLLAVILCIMKWNNSNYTREDVTQLIIQGVQQSYFSEEITQLKSKAPIHASSRLSKLDPYLDDNNLIRVGGRLRNLDKDSHLKHPVVLPSASHVSCLLVRHLHERSAHQGRNSLLNTIRQNGYHILNGTRLVNSVIFKCIHCRKLRGKALTQKMADLPVFRVADQPPFTNVGMDCFGPFEVKDNRKVLKKYGLLLTCMSSRAVHIEVLDDMSTDAFINGLRSFIALRGPVSNLYSDQGTNFVGAKNEFEVNMSFVTDHKLKAYLTMNNCQFHFNTPYSSHMGGAWERMVRSIREILRGLLSQHPSRLDSTSLRTLMYECMAIVNARPLTTTNLSHPTEPEPLTPNHLLTMKLDPVSAPPGEFPPEDVYSRRRWRRVQALSEQFWSRWRSEYLSSLQSRGKWKTETRNLRKDDVVLLRDDDAGCFRNMWRLAVVIDTHPGSDGLVRQATVRCQNKIIKRPITRMVLLVESDG